MSTLKPILRELKQAAPKGGVHAKDKLHQVADNLDGHFDTVIRRVTNNDRYDGPGGGGSGSGNSNDQPYSHGVRFFGGDQLDFYTRDNATLGREGSAVFMMPAEMRQTWEAPWMRPSRAGWLRTSPKRR